MDNSHILGAVVHKDPDWAALPPSIPDSIRILLRRCLQKDARERLRDAADVRIQIEEALTASSAIADPVTLHAPTPAPRHWQLLGAAACVAVAAITGIIVWQLKPAPATFLRPVERLVSILPANTTLAQAILGLLALSPDGRRLAYAAIASGSPQRLYVRPMDGLEATPLAGTEGAFSPFFSPVVSG